MKTTFILLAIAISLIIIPIHLSEPSLNGPSPGCSGSGCHTFSDGDVSVTILDPVTIEVTISGTTDKVAGELVDEGGSVVDVINSTTNNPFTLTVPAAGNYIVNAGYKNPSKKWDSAMVVISPAPTTFPLAVTVVDGWNMVSIPGLHPVDQNVSTWWSNLTGSVFGFNGGYVATTTATTGEGYWMKNTGAETYNYPAIDIVTHDPIPALTGWNMIGGYENNAPTAGLTTTPPGLISGSVFGYSGGYVTATTLDPGYGYWIKLTGDGVINIPSGPMAKGSVEVVEYIQDDWGKITITDATGKNFTLYAVNGEVNLDNYELPPMPPSGMFDIRYDSDRLAEDINSTIKTIKMTSLEYPITVQVDGMDIRLQDETGNQIDENIKSGDQITISNSQINKLMVTGEMIPDVYALEQNYPNPFNPSTKIKYTILQSSQIIIKVFDVLGNEITTLLNKEKQAGSYEVEFNGSGLTSGIYFYRLQAGNFVKTKKMVLMK